MPLSLNEIREHARAFVQEWPGETSKRVDAKRVAFLFGRYQALTSLLPTEKTKSLENTKENQGA